MLAAAIRERLTSPEFRPFTLVLANGERIDVKHRDSAALPSVEVNGKRFFRPWLDVLETKGDEVIDRTISLPMIAQIIDSHRLNGA